MIIDDYQLKYASAPLKLEQLILKTKAVAMTIIGLDNLDMRDLI